MIVIEISGGSYFTVDGRPYKRNKYQIAVDGSDRFTIYDGRETVINNVPMASIQDGKGNTFSDSAILLEVLSMFLFSDNDSVVDYAIREIYQQDNIIVRTKGKSLLKFGQRTDIGTSNKQTLMTLAGDHEVFPAANAIDTISSSDVDDDQDIVVEGHTVSGDELTFVSQIATLNGQSKVVLTTPLHRATRIYNSDSTELEGTVYCYEESAITAGVPDDNTKVHVTIDIGNQQSRKAATSLSNLDYWIITTADANVNKKVNANIDISLELRERGGVFRDRIIWTEGSGLSGGPRNFNPALISIPNSDIRVTAISDSVGTSVSGWINGYLAEITARIT